MITSKLSNSLTVQRPIALCHFFSLKPIIPSKAIRPSGGSSHDYFFDDQISTRKVLTGRSNEPAQT